MNIETERNTLRDEVKKLQNELQFGRDQMMRKNDEFNAALDDLSNAHRTAEDGRVNAIQELESRKFEITDLQSRLDNAEERLNTLQQEYLKADRERDMLNDSMRRFQSIISHTVISETSVVDMQSLDVHLQNVMNRIEKLERERVSLQNDYRDSLSRLKRKTSDSTIAVTKHETLYRTIEDRVADVEEGKRNAEIKLIKAKELVSSQGEQLKQYEEERRTMKSKIMMFEMEARGKDAKIRHLSDLIKTLKSDLENARSEVHNLRDREDRYEMTKVHVEKQVTSDDSEARLRQMMTSFETERQVSELTHRQLGIRKENASLKWAFEPNVLRIPVILSGYCLINSVKAFQGFNDTVRKLTSQLSSLQTKNSDLKDDVDKLKRDLSDAEKTEAELRRNFDEKSRVAIEVQHLKDQVSAKNRLIPFFRCEHRFCISN
ncbi:unnamed protein product [Anisakis simplex]|uniref:Myosin_tail_1 domain-containing protein n=1 Tax=Anisakis simplex TaxID=6269 RepID=A0A0M3KB56_ANISI|nr:unnamed protein product [Anisakis simplex]